MWRNVHPTLGKAGAIQRISFNDDWYAYSRDNAFSLVTAIPADAVHTSVPYDALWHEGQRPDSANGGRTSYFDGQVYYYQRELVLDPALRDMRLLLKFEAIFSKSFVYVNGSQVASGDFGYASLTCDITDYVRWAAPNMLLTLGCAQYAAGGVQGRSAQFAAVARQGSVADGGDHRALELALCLFNPSDNARCSLPLGWQVQR